MPRSQCQRLSLHVLLLALLLLAGCNSATAVEERADHCLHCEPAALIPRDLSAAQIDPQIYFDIADPSDPFAEVYANFRARRAADMINPDKPRPVEAYQSVHRNSEKPWAPLEEILAADWQAIANDYPEALRQLRDAVKVRIALDHPDVKIVQMMLAPGAYMPAHAEGAPGLYYVIGGSGEIGVEGQTQTATPGTVVKLNPFDVRQIYAASPEGLKLLWFRWAPGGDQSYLKAGYYLTGANQHIQPKEAVLDDGFQFWGQAYSTESIDVPVKLGSRFSESSFIKQQREQLQVLRQELGAARDLYPNSERFSHESDKDWLTKGMEVNFFWAKDILSIGELLDRWIEVMRYKGFFQASRPAGGWDFNISQMVWGPHARYVEHSHSIPEFYYMVSGPVEHWLGDTKYIAQAGDVFLTNSYQPHESRGIVDDLPFRNISASWAPNGDRTVFQRPMFLLEPLSEQSAGATLEASSRFH